MSRDKRTVSTDLICLECGNIFTIQRRIGRLKKVGHVKHIFCNICNKVQPHYEIRDANTFIWSCYGKNYNYLDENTKVVLEFLMKREDNDVREEDRIHKKVLTRK